MLQLKIAEFDFTANNKYCRNETILGKRFRKRPIKNTLFFQGPVVMTAISLSLAR